MVRKIKAKLILRLHDQGLSGRAIARSRGISRRGVADALAAVFLFNCLLRFGGADSKLDVHMSIFRPRLRHETLPCVISQEG